LVADKMIEDTFERQFVVSFTNPVAQEKLQTIPNVTSVHSIGKNQFIISFSQQGNHGEHIFDFAVKYNLKLNRLEEKQLNIEDLFKSVTA